MSYQSAAANQTSWRPTLNALALKAMPSQTFVVGAVRLPVRSLPPKQQRLTKSPCTPKLRSLKELLNRQSPGQLGPQSQSLSRSYGSSLPTSLTYMCLTLQRLRTLETGCGYRVRTIPNLSGVCMSIYTDKCIEYRVFLNPRPRLHGPAGTPRRTRQTWRSAARLTLSPAELLSGMRTCVKQKRKLFLGRPPAAAAWFHLHGPFNGASHRGGRDWSKNEVHIPFRRT